jgi:protein phosphatase 1G
MQGWRKTMEDSHIAIPNLINGNSLFGVFDGHGGSEVAQYVRDNLPNIIKSSPLLKSKQWKELFTNSFAMIDVDLPKEKAQAELKAYYKKGQHDEFSQSSEVDIHKHVGCTACAALISDTEIIVANAGDSRCVMGKKGTAVELSADHKPDLDSEKKRIIDAGGYVEDNRVNGVLNLSRSIGDFEYKGNQALKPDKQLVISLPDVDIQKISKETDFIVIACDGIWECWESQKVVEFIYSKLSPTVKLSQIIDELFEKIISPDANSSPLGCDNMSCIIIQFKK